MEIKSWIAVFIGGGLGSLARFGLGKTVNYFHNHHFPWATFIINIFACFILGFLVELADHKQILSPVTRLFWVVGFCGGFSTFSAFSNDILTLFQQGHNISLILYILLSILIWVIATFSGLFIAERI